MTRTAARLAVFLPSLESGGAERVAANLTTELARRGVEVELVLASAVGPLLDAVSADVRVVGLGATRARRAVKPLADYLDAARPDVLLSMMHHANVAAYAAHRRARSSSRLVLSERTHLTQLLNAYSTPYRIAMRLMLRRAYRRADAVLCVSEGVAEDLRRHGFGHSRIEVAYNPTISADLALRADQPVSHPWFSDDGGPVLVAVGRLEPEKDYPTLLRALAMMKRGDIRLVILGEGRERSNLDALARHLGLDQRLAMPGFVSNPAAYVSKASAFVLSSAFEGLPNALIEALPLGVPLVSTDCPSGPAEVLQGGRHGALVPVGDPGAMASALDDAIEGRGVAPRPEAGRPFTVEACTDRYCEILFPSA